MSQQEIDQLITMSLVLNASDTDYINSQLDALVVWVSPLYTSSGSANLNDYIALANRVTTYQELSLVAEGVYQQSNKLIQTGVRADKGARPIKS